MFSIRQKREIADAVQKILRATNHPELPVGEIRFHLHIDGAALLSWANIKNNGAVEEPDTNEWNELQVERGKLRPSYIAEIQAFIEKVAYTKTEASVKLRIEAFSLIKKERGEV